MDEEGRAVLSREGKDQDYIQRRRGRSIRS